MPKKRIPSPPGRSKEVAVILISLFLLVILVAVFLSFKGKVVGSLRKIEKRRNVPQPL